MRKAWLIEQAEDDCVIGNGVEQVRALCERAKYQTEWYAVRWKALHEHLEMYADSDLFESCCSIMANGTPTSMDPPTYAQIINSLNAAIEQAAALADTGSHAHKSRFDPDDIGEQPSGWGVAQAMRERLLDAKKYSKVEPDD